MKNWINYIEHKGLLNMPENFNNLNEVVEMLNANFNLEGYWDKIGRLNAEIISKAQGFNLIEMPFGGQIFEPSIFLVDPFQKEMTKIEHELFEISKIIEKIDQGEAATIEFQIKINKNKGSNKTVIISHPEIIPQIIELLKQLPKGKVKPSPKKGDNEKPQLKKLIIESVDKCFQLIESIEIEPKFNEMDKLFFAGLILTLAGIISPPQKYYPELETNPAVIADYKKKLTDYLKYYKSAKD